MGYPKYMRPSAKICEGSKKREGSAGEKKVRRRAKAVPHAISIKLAGMGCAVTSGIKKIKKTFFPP
jgi:hypothetical protein